jgi:integrase
MADTVFRPHRDQAAASGPKESRQESEEGKREVVADSPNKKPKVRRTGQRETIVAGKKYRLRVFLEKDSAGKRHFHSETFHGSAGQAEDRIREIIRRHRAGEAIKLSSDTFGAFLDEWLESKKLSVAESTLVNYQWNVNAYIRPALGAKMLTRVFADDIQRLYVKLHTDDKLCRTSIGHVHTVLNMVFKLAVRRKKLMGSPMAGVEIPQEWAENEDDHPKARAMTADQVAKFLEAAEGNKFENLFKLAFHVGFRPGELLALKWADFDQQARTLRVNQNIVFRKADDWYLKKPKTPQSRRTLPLTDAMIVIIGAERKKQLEMRLKAGKLWQDHGFIFADATGDPYPHWTLRGNFKRIAKAAGLPASFSSKTTRHTMATVLIAAETPAKVVSERMGHSKITTTLQQYTHVSPGMQADVSDKIEQLLKGKK